MISNDWQPYLSKALAEPSLQSLLDFLATEIATGKYIFPPQKDWFRAFAATPFAKVKVVILGQDPYHGLGQAEGLSFSVPPGVKIPPSLQNIMKEIECDIGKGGFIHGHLGSWADQGVLLLNSVLTVEENRAGAHENQGWELFTDQVIQVLNQEKSHLVFMLWGSYAQKKGALLDTNKHLVLTAPHPSPLSAYRGFIGCKHFSQANQYLQSKQKTAIRWV